MRFLSVYRRNNRHEILRQVIYNFLCRRLKSQVGYYAGKPTQSTVYCISFIKWTLDVCIFFRCYGAINDRLSTNQGTFSISLILFRRKLFTVAN